MSDSRLRTKGGPSGHHDDGKGNAGARRDDGATAGRVRLTGHDEGVTRFTHCQKAMASAAPPKFVRLAGPLLSSMKLL
jgi:hypothetical protein